MSYMKRTVFIDDISVSETSGTPTLGNKKAEPRGRTRPPLSMWTVVPTELTALMDAVESADEEGSGFDLLNIERIESFWQMLDLHSTAHGFVLSLRDGSRVYLQLITATDDDKPVEEVELLPMRLERYPDLDGGGIFWIDEVAELNRFLKS